VRELEDLLIDCVYLGTCTTHPSTGAARFDRFTHSYAVMMRVGLIKGKLDQKKGAFEVQYAIGRDIGPTDVDFMMKKLNTWYIKPTLLHCWC
jgi:hypothetical protein